MQGNNLITIQPDPKRVALRNLEKEKHPALYTMLFEQWHGKLFDTLTYYWFQQDTIPNQHLRPGGYYEFFQSRRYSADKGHYVSRDPRAWQYRTVLLHCLGLISTRRPKPGDDLSTIEKESIRLMYDNRIRYFDDRYHSITFITTELWSLDKLDYSEKQAQKWLDNPQQVSYLTKENIIRVFGQELADEVYCDDRCIPKTSLFARKALKQAIKDTIRRKGYTTKEKGIDKASKTISRLSARKAWAKHSYEVLAELGYRYHRPTISEKAKYRIKADNNRWIITPKHVEVPESESDKEPIK